MALTREQKGVSLAKIERIIKENPTVFLVDLMRAKTLDVTAFKANLITMGAGYMVVKKTLAHKVFSQHGLEFPNWEAYKGSVGLVWASANEIDVAKAVQKFVKEISAKPKMKDTVAVLGGFMDKAFIARPQVIMLSQIPGREVLLGQLVNVIASPMAGLVYALNYNLQQFVMTVKAIADSKK